MDEIEMQKRLLWYSNKYGPYIEKRGLSNWKNLFRKPTLMEWTILFMVIMMLFIAWAYQHDTALCRETIEHIDETCLKYKTTYVQLANVSIQEINYSLFSFTNGS